MVAAFAHYALTERNKSYRENELRLKNVIQWLMIRDIDLLFSSKSFIGAHRMNLEALEMEKWKNGSLMIFDRLDPTESS